MRISDWSSDVCSSDLLQPSEISDNGQFTVMRFPGNHEIPAIYLVRPDGSESLVPLDVRDEFVVVHAVAAPLRLRRNREVLCLYHLAPTPYAVDHEIGRATWQDSGCPYVSVRDAAVSLNNKTTQ